MNTLWCLQPPARLIAGGKIVRQTGMMTGIKWANRGDGAEMSRRIAIDQDRTGVRLSWEAR